MSGQLVELKNTVKIKQTTISELKECLRKKDSENEHLKSNIVDFTTVQNLRAQVTKLKSENEDLTLLVEKLTKAHEIVETTLRERDEMVFAQSEKIRLLEEQCESFYEVQKEYNDLLASNDVLKQRLETKFKFLKHDNSLEKMIEMIKKEYESNVSKISITSSTFETKNLELVKEIWDKVKHFDDEKKVFETKISKLEKVLAQRVKDFDDVKIELSRRTDKFETYFVNLEKENALLKS
ncbi:hypothetical protein Tco_1026802 [Tanacetum coccineum]